MNLTGQSAQRVHLLLKSFLLTLLLNFAAIPAFATSNVELILECVKDLGNGKYEASFGYNNPYDYEISVKKSRSFILYNNGHSKTYVNRIFKPGLNKEVVKFVFDEGDKIYWKVYFGWFRLKFVAADAHAERCIVDLIPLFDGQEEGGVLWPELNFLSQQDEGLQSNEIFQIDNNTPGAEKVLIEVIPFENTDTTVLKNELASLGFLRFPEGSNPRIFAGLLPISNLQAFNASPLNTLTKFVRPMYTPLSEATEKSGIVGTQQDRALRADLVRKAFDKEGELGIDGSGITLGIISDSYANSLAAVSSAESSGDLPVRGTTPDSQMQILSDWTGSFGLFGGTDEGNAMTQIAYDIAPGAKFKFATGALSAERMAFEYRRLAEAGCDIVIDDILHLGEPFAPKGQIAKAVEDVIASGVHVMSSAGNYKDHSILENFSSAPIPASFDEFGNPLSTAHDWGNGQILKEVQLSPGVFVLEMQWLDDFFAQGEGSGAAYNMDIWIVTETGQKVYSGNRDNIGEDPIEIVGFIVENPVTLNLMITGENIPGSLPFQVVILRAPSNPFGWQFTEGNDQVFSGTTILGHSAQPDNSAIGAAFFGFTPAFDFQPDRLLEPFSSSGGPILGGGAATPAYTAPDAGNNTFFGTDLPPEFDAIDNDDFPNFAGTSAAVPAAAGVNALILQAYKDFYGLDKVAPAALKALVQSTSLDFGNPNSGAGLMQADKTLLSLANPSPDLKELIFPENYDISTAGNEPFILKAQIFYPILTYDENGDLVLINGAPVPLLENNGTSFSLRDTELVLEPYDDGSLYQWINVDEYILEVNLSVPEFIGNPSFTITNAAKADGDGGSITVENILDKPLTEILVKANDASKLFGEDIPFGEFSYDIFLRNDETPDPNDWILAENIPLTPVELAALANAIQITTPATFQSLVGSYSIKNEVLDQSIINELSESYIINGLGEDNSGWGVLSVDLLPVTVSAANPADGVDFVESVYGNPIPFEMVYDFMNGDNPPSISPENVEWVENYIKTSHQELLVPDSVFIIANKGLALVEKGLALAEKGLALVEQSSWVISEKGLALAEKGLALVEKGLALVEGQSAIEIGIDVASTFLVDEQPVSPFISEKGLALVEGQEFIGLAPGDTYSIGEKGLALAEKGLALVEKGLALVEDENGVPKDSINLHFVLEASDTEINENIKSINFVSGLDVLPDGFFHYISPGALLNENLAVKYKNVKLKITPRPIDIIVEDQFPGEPQNFEKIFGQPDPEFSFSVSPDTPLALDDGMDVFGETKLGRNEQEDVGIYELQIGQLSAGTNYSINLNLLNPDDEGAPKLKITPATLFVNAQDTAKVFSESDPVFEFTVTPEVDRSVFIGALSRSDIDNENIGEYTILQGDLAAGLNYTIKFTSATFSITPLTLKVNAINSEKVYGDFDPAFEFAVIPDLNKAIFSGALSRSDTDNENVGVYEILLGDLTAGSNYTIEFTAGSFAITQAPLIVSAISEAHPIHAGDPLPEFDFTFSGFIDRFGDNDENVSFIPDVNKPPTIPEYFGSAGVYQINFNYTTQNYEITQQQPSNDPGLLYVNPDRPRNITPRLDCVEENLAYDPSNSNPNDPSAYQYIAHLYYENPNSSGIYIPIGKQNQIYYAQGSGKYYAPDQPIYFEPGKDMGLFDVYFTGEKMIYSITSSKSAKTAAMSSDASDGGGRCKLSASGARIAGSSQKGDFSDFESNQIEGYPNPTSNMYYVNLSPEWVDNVNLTLVDVQGRMHDARFTRNASRGRIELDVINLKTGLYLLKVDFGHDQKVLKILKE